MGIASVEIPEGRGLQRQRLRGPADVRSGGHGWQCRGSISGGLELPVTGLSCQQGGIHLGIHLSAGQPQAGLLAHARLDCRYCVLDDTVHQGGTQVAALSYGGPERG